MRSFLIRRFFFGILTLFGATAMVFGLSRAAGDPLLLYAAPGSYGMTPQQKEALRQKLGLNHPLVVQYLMWVGNTLKGNLGNTLVNQVPVKSLIAARIGATMELGLGAFIFCVFVGIPLGVLSAVKRGTVWDYLGRSFALFGQALPNFWVGLMAILIFAVILGWLPVGTNGPSSVSIFSWTRIRYFILPVITLGWLPAAAFLRLTRSSMLEVLDSEYVKLARIKGVNERSVIWRHAFRNATLQPLTLSAVTLAGFVTGAVVVERVFAWPGIGQLTIQAVWNNDFPTLTAAVLMFTGIFVAMNFFADVMYAVIDPRVRYR